MDVTGLRWQPFSTKTLRSQPLEYGSIVFRGTKHVHITNGSVVVIGAFDGLHIGHQYLVKKAVAEAREKGIPCIAATFVPDPAVVLLGRERASGNRLLKCTDRVAGLIELGVDAVYLMSFDVQLARTEPDVFVDEILIPCTCPLSVHVGNDFRFGDGGRGDLRLLRDLGSQHGFTVRGYDLVRKARAEVSATRVRKLLKSGKLDEAHQLLNRHHYVHGIVEHGRGEGTSFGFPTANIRCEIDDCLPLEGVYACFVQHEGYAWPAAANVGAPPSFSERDDTLIEANLIGFSGNLYGEDVCITFVKWLRAKRVFSSLEELEDVVLGNIAWVTTHLGSQRIEVGRD